MLFKMKILDVFLFLLQAEIMGAHKKNTYLRLFLRASTMKWTWFFFAGVGGGVGGGKAFVALSRIFHLYRAECSSKVGEKRRTRGKNQLTIRKQNFAFPHVTWARLEPQRWET